MNNLVLWRRLTETDFNAMHGNASPHGRGGGAMHIALGVRTDTFPIDRFLNARRRAAVTVQTIAFPGNHAAATLTFGSNPTRRGGEWLIRDQFSHRHPAWSPAAGFPTAYSHTDPPYVFVFRVGDTYHVRFAFASQLAILGVAAIPADLHSSPKGIAPAPPGFLAALSVPLHTLFSTFEEEAKSHASEPFDPKSVTDGRQRIIASILRRLGQRSFRRKLLSAYSRQCAITGCTTVWVLEAAHITPYRGLKTNAVSNGMLLRADIHTLFDLCLISIEPSQMTLCVSSLLGNSQYTEFDGRVPMLPGNSSDRPSTAAIREHFSLFQP